MLAFAPAIDQDAHWRISQFLLYETSLLDARRLTDWLDVVAPDFRYRIPVPVTKDNPELAPYATNAFLVEETRESIETLWVKRYEPEFFEYAWGENPPQRIRRFVTNTVIRPAEEPGTYLANSNVMLSFARQADPVVLVTADRVDTIREEPEGLRLAGRTVLLDETVVKLTHMRVIF